MNSHHHTKLVHEGRYAAEVEVDLIDTDTGWSPYLSLSDAQKLDDVRRALRGGDLKRASQLARVFQLLPVTVPLSRSLSNIMRAHGMLPGRSLEPRPT